MGTISARKLREQIDLVYLQLGVHLLAACQAMDLVASSTGSGVGDVSMFSPLSQSVYREVRRLSAYVQDDRQLDAEATAVAQWAETTELFA